MGLAQLGEGDCVVSVGEFEDDPAAAGAADRRDLDSGGVGSGEEGEQAIVADGCDIDPLVFGEEPRGPARQRLVDEGADIAGQSHFGEGYGEAAVGDVVAGGDRAAGDSGPDELGGGALGGE